MAIQILYRAQAFGPGSDIWILPENEKSPLLKKMDWYLNFQLTRARWHKREEPPPQLKNILNENNLPNFSQEIPAKAPLMIVAENHLPVKAVIEVPGAAKARSWVEQIHKLWDKFEHPQLRVFLPANITVDEFKEAWPGPTNKDILLVPS